MSLDRIDSEQAAGSASTSVALERTPTLPWWVPASLELDRKQATWLYAVMALVAVIMFYDLSGYRTLTTHEGFVAITAREMLNSGDWVVPTHGGIPRLKKPPLAYWIVAAISSIGGEVTEFTSRLPSAVSSMLLALLMFFWAKRWYGAQAGIWAALVQGTSAYVISFGRKSEVDLLVWLLATAAMYLVARDEGAPGNKCRPVPWFAFYLLLSLGWLGKFHFGPTMVLAPVIVFYAIERRWRDLRSLVHPAGIVLFAAAIFVWPLLVMRREPDAWYVWASQTVGRAVGALGRDPVWFYFVQVPWMCLPWTFVITWGIPSSWRKAWREHDTRERFLWIWFITQFAIVTASSFKHHHYIGTALPMCALMASRKLSAWTDAVRAGDWSFSRRAAAVSSCCAVIIAGAFSTFIFTKWPHLSAASCMVSGSILFGVICSAWLVHVRKFSAAAAVAMLFTAVCYASFTSGIMPARDHRMDAAYFARDIRSGMLPSEEICVFNMEEHVILFYVGAPVYRIETEKELCEQLKRTPKLRVVTYADESGHLAGPVHARMLKVMERHDNFAEARHAPLVLLELSNGEFTQQSQSHQSAASANNDSVRRE